MDLPAEMWFRIPTFLKGPALAACAATSKTHPLAIAARDCQPVRHLATKLMEGAPAPNLKDLAGAIRRLFKMLRRDITAADNVSERDKCLCKFVRGEISVPAGRQELWEIYAKTLWIKLSAEVMLDICEVLGVLAGVFGFTWEFQMIAPTTLRISEASDTTDLFSGTHPLLQLVVVQYASFASMKGFAKFRRDGAYFWKIFRVRIEALRGGSGRPQTTALLRMLGILTQGTDLTIYVPTW